MFSPTDNVTLQIDGVLYLRVMDPYKVPSLLCWRLAGLKLAASVAAPSPGSVCRLGSPSGTAGQALPAPCSPGCVLQPLPGLLHLVGRGG